MSDEKEYGESLTSQIMKRAKRFTPLPFSGFGPDLAEPSVVDRMAAVADQEIAARVKERDEEIKRRAEAQKRMRKAMREAYNSIRRSQPMTEPIGVAFYRQKYGTLNARDEEIISE